MDIALMIEGQEGVSWEQWVALATACEEHGVPALFRSDHYMNLDGLHPERGSLDAWGTICALAAVTSDVALGTMVSPATFRHPSQLARIVATADLISGGRVSLGLGAGWHEREHAAHGFDYHDSLGERMDVMEEQLDVILGAWADGPYDFSGTHYQLTQLDAQPKPAQKPHPPIILGGVAAPRGARLAALFADEYNTVMATAEQAAQRRATLDTAAERVHRSRPLPLSVMTLTIIGTDQADLDARVAAVASAGEVGPAEFLKRADPSWIIATVDDALERFAALAEAGVSRVMCQHLAHWDLDFVEILGRQIRPRLP